MPRGEGDVGRADHADRNDGKASKLTWLLPLAAVAALVGLYFVWPAYQSFVKEAYEVVSTGEQDQIESWIRGHGSWGFIVLIGLMLFQAVVAILPSIAVMVASVLAYGPFLGGLLAWVGMVVTAAVAYGLGRCLGPVTVDKMIGQKSRKKIEAAVERYGVWAVIAARLSPVFSTDAVSFVAGLVKMSFLRFIVATAIGTLPLVGFIAALGEDMDKLEVGLIVVSVVSVVMFIGYVIWDRWRQKRHPSRARPEEKGKREEDAGAHAPAE